MSNTASKPNRGLVKIGKNKAVVNDLDIPALRDDYILVKVVAVALNPADWQDLSEPFDPSSKPLLIGTDFAGIVEAVGDKVTKEFKKGDRVAGLVHGSMLHLFIIFMQAYHFQKNGFIFLCEAECATLSSQSRRQP